MDNSTDKSLLRWRLLLGNYAEEQLPLPEESHYREIDSVLNFLYDREFDESRDIRGEKKGSLENSMLTVPLWINKIRRLFSTETCSIMEKHALEKYELTSMLADKKVMENLEPNTTLLGFIIQMKSILKQDVKEAAYKIVQKVVDDLMGKLEADVKRSLSGRVNKSDFSGRPSMNTIDFNRTIKKNLKNYDKEKKRIVIEHLHCNSRQKNFNPWNIIIAVDQSGSMINSVIYSAIMASIFWKLPMIKSHLITFDTNIVDLSDHLHNPVETLMSVQLGGGTNITKALHYCNSLIDTPGKTVVIVISDLYEGYSYTGLYNAVELIVQSEATLMILPSLDENSQSDYNKRAAEKIQSLGGHFAVLSPEKLADWVAGILH